ncbi:MAG: PLP-dependent transferase [Methanoregulaceae archaeon]|nr:PLP-dependent transferase [Methanoregulaceae archaeon]
MDQQWGDGTRLQHVGEEVKHCGAVNPPIFQNSLFVFDDLDVFLSRDRKPDGPGFSYSRLGNPSLTIVEKKIAALERTDKAKVFGSGMAAISAALLACVEQGSHVLAVDMCYGPTQGFLNEYLNRFGVTVSYVSGVDTDELLAAIRPETTVLYLESPSSLIFRMQDFRTITAECRRRGITTITDNSYSGGIHQKPATMGVDVVVHSATKYLAGHSDLVAGVVAGSEQFIDRLTEREINWLGGLIMPMGAWLLMRGMRTLKLRMRHAEEQGNALAQFLTAQSWVERVHHVGLDDFPQRDLRDSQMSGCSSLLSFEPKDQDADKLRRFIEALQIFQLGVSWGGFESLAVPLEISPMGWDGPRRLVRLYAGLEEMEDLTADLTQAAAQAW